RHPAALATAARYVEAGLAAGPGRPVPRHTYRVEAGEVANLEVTLPGAAEPAAIVVIGAHYDTVPTTPGADDNASGVAALLELGRRLKGAKLPKTVRLVAFTNEEPPFFKTAQMGSVVYARAAAAAGDRVVAMVSLETLGYYDPRPGSQTYPPGLGLLYPDRGDYLAFVGNTGSAALVTSAVEAFRGAVDFPAESIAAPAFVTGVDFSDHWSFWQAGFPQAVMVTDTAFMRNRHYHEPTDTPERLDYARLARVVDGLEAVVRRLAGGAAPSAAGH
ncbi:MAG: M20/M25/M40 family metallo-hydrolase, partial [Myxococcales bacterium]|nr:M20/M25/M40 family metallo-hydrolase [Myxococcales bacterium]